MLSAKANEIIWHLLFAFFSGTSDAAAQIDCGLLKDTRCVSYLASKGAF